MNLSRAAHWFGGLPVGLQLWVGLTLLVVVAAVWVLVSNLSRLRSERARRRAHVPVTDSSRKARDEHAAAMLTEPGWYIGVLLKAREGEFTDLQALARQLGDGDLEEADEPGPEPDSAPAGEVFGPLAEHGPMPRRVPAHVPEEALPEPEPEYTDLFGGPPSPAQISEAIVQALKLATRFTRKAAEDGAQ